MLSLGLTLLLGQLVDEERVPGVIQFLCEDPGLGLRLSEFALQLLQPRSVVRGEALDVDH